MWGYDIRGNLWLEKYVINEVQKSVYHNRAHIKWIFKCALIKGFSSNVDLPE